MARAEAGGVGLAAPLVQEKQLFAANICMKVQGITQSQVQQSGDNPKAKRAHTKGGGDRAPAGGARRRRRSIASSLGRYLYGRQEPSQILFGDTSTIANSSALK